MNTTQEYLVKTFSVVPETRRLNKGLETVVADNPENAVRKCIMEHARQHPTQYLEAKVVRICLPIDVSKRDFDDNKYFGVA